MDGPIGAGSTAKEPTMPATRAPAEASTIRSSVSLATGVDDSGRRRPNRASAITTAISTLAYATTCAAIKFALKTVGRLVRPPEQLPEQQRDADQKRRHQERKSSPRE